jgi:hypothetical protein
VFEVEVNASTHAWTTGFEYIAQLFDDVLLFDESSQLSAGVSAAGAKVPVPNQLSWATDCEAFRAAA